MKVNGRLLNLLPAVVMQMKIFLTGIGLSLALPSSFHAQASETLKASISTTAADQDTNAGPEPVYPKIHHFGPNCWNFTLKTAGAIDSYRSVTLHEFLHYVNSRYCQKVVPSARHRKGDIGSLILPNGGLVHSFVFINDQTAYSKGSPYIDKQITKEDINILQSAKDSRIVYHRCDFSSLGSEMRVALPDVDAKLAKIEARIQEHLVSSDPIDVSYLKDTLDQLLSLRSSRVLPAANHISGFGPMALLYRTDSLISQIFMLLNEAGANLNAEEINKVLAILNEAQARDRSAKIS